MRTQRSATCISATTTRPLDLLDCSSRKFGHFLLIIPAIRKGVMRFDIFSMFLYHMLRNWDGSLVDMLETSRTGVSLCDRFVLLVLLSTSIAIFKFTFSSASLYTMPLTVFLFSRAQMLNFITVGQGPVRTYELQFTLRCLNIVLFLELSSHKHDHVIFLRLVSAVMHVSRLMALVTVIIISPLPRLDMHLSPCTFVRSNV